MNALQRSIASVIRYSIRQKIYIYYSILTVQNWGLSGLKNIWPVIRTGALLSDILSPADRGLFEETSHASETSESIPYVLHDMAENRCKQVHA